jgi:hypothetical protein
MAMSKPNVVATGIGTKLNIRPEVPLSSVTEKRRGAIG